MEKLIKPDELAEKLGVSLKTIYAWSHQNQIPRVPGMRLLRFREREILDWLDRESKPAGKAPAAMNSQRTPRRSGMNRENREIDRIVSQVKSEVLG